MTPEQYERQVVAPGGKAPVAARRRGRSFRRHGRSSADRSGFEKRPWLGSRTLSPMKTMTCKQLGGPCNVEHHGKDHNEVIKAQDRHLKAQVAAGDETHREAHEAMRGRWRRPVSGLAWYRDVKREFAGLPEDA
jgi:predicted small metal-binding protein